MAKYIYPAVFTPEEGGSYSVIFKDLEGCYTCGENLEDAMEMAADVLALVLYGYETDKKPIPTPSDITKVEKNDNEFVNYILADTLEYRKMYNSKAVKKTLTIPEWLNTEAMEEGINFSAVLQEALQERLMVK
jgi:predicted RNase H-like HicB family nuclease